MSTAIRSLNKAVLEHSSGNFALIDTLRRWGITFFSGVNGGGLIHVTKHLEPFLDVDQAGDGVPRMQTMSEYVAGFVPLGYYLASGRIAGCLTTTGAATKLGSSGITDAKLHYHERTDEFYYVIAGRGTMVLDGEEIDLHPGIVVYVPRGVRHKAKGDLTVLTVCIPRGVLNDVHELE